MDDEQILSTTRIRAKRWIWAILIACIGTLFIIFGFFLEPDRVRPKLWSVVFVEIGIAALIAAIAEFVLIDHASREMRLEVRALLRKVQGDYRIVANSLAQGLTDVLAGRRVEQTAWQVISTALEQSRGDVLISGISLKEFLDGAHPIYVTLHKLLEHDEDVKVKMILLDPNSDAARMRSKVEQGTDAQYERTQLYKDIGASVASLRALQTQSASCSQFTIDSVFSNTMPPTYSIITPDALFLEVYHCGRLKSDGPCVGGFVPMLRFDKSHAMYERMVAHFWYVWRSRAPSANRPDSHSPDNVGSFDGEILVVRTLEEVDATLA
jgi:hypothetical protein